MAMENATKISLRYAGTAAATAFTIMGAMSILTADQVASLKADLETLKTSIITGYGALTDMGILLGPVVGGWMGQMGIKSGTVHGLISNLLAKAQGPASPGAVRAQKAIFEATGTIAQNKSIPASQEAVNTLVNATIDLPQVQTIVT